MKQFITLIILILSFSQSYGQGIDYFGSVVIPKNVYLVKLASSNLYWDIPGHPNANSKNADVQLAALDNEADRKLMFIPAGNGYYFIKFQHNGYYLTSNGINLQIKQANRNDTQKFKVISKGNNQFKFISINKLAIDYLDNKLRLNKDTGSKNQTYEILEANTKRSL